MDCASVCLGPEVLFCGQPPRGWVSESIYRCHNGEAILSGEGGHRYRRFRDLGELVRKLCDRRIPGTRDRVAWRSSQTSVCVSLIHDAGLNSIYMFRTESHDHMGPVGEDPRWIVFGPFHDCLQGTSPPVYVFLPVVCLITGTSGGRLYFQSRPSSTKAASPLRPDPRLYSSSLRGAEI